MTHALIICMIVVVILGDSLHLFPLVDDVTPAGVLLWLIGPTVALFALMHALLQALGRAIDRTGRLGHLRTADLLILSSRIGFVAIFGAAITVFGWADLVRSLTGRIVLLDEAVIFAPTLAAIIMSWASFYPIERRLRDAMLISRLDRGEPIHRTPSRFEFVLDRVRHQLAIVLVPISLIYAWHESAYFAVNRWMAPDDRLAGLGPDAVASLVNIVGVGVVFLVTPLLLRIIWDTIPLAASDLRERLERLCVEQGVRCRRILLWRTHGTMINGAVIGLIGRLRYILLTDALLERLTNEEVEAVMAHEVAHARFHHLPWLMLAMAESFIILASLFWILAEWATREARIFPEDISIVDHEAILAATTMPLSMLGALFIFGFVSRRFERQADAFAAQHLSGRSRELRRRRDILISAESVQAMADALDAVARFNFIPLDRFTWRHGSLLQRQRCLYNIVGEPAHALPIDRSVRRIKIGCLILLAGLIVVAFLDTGGAA